VSEGSVLLISAELDIGAKIVMQIGAIFPRHNTRIGTIKLIELRPIGRRIELDSWKIGKSGNWLALRPTEFTYRLRRHTRSPSLAVTKLIQGSYCGSTGLLCWHFFAHSKFI